MSKYGLPYEKGRTKFRLTVRDQNGDPLDISSATSMQIRFRLPDGTRVQKTAYFVTDGKDGVLEYESDSTFLIPGILKYHVSVTIGGKQYYGGNRSGRPLSVEVESIL